jgi:uncharacterized damage-inducible protein DinB
MSDPEVWLRGPLPDYPALLQPVAHALLQSREDLAWLTGNVLSTHLWSKPGGAASVGFHILHIAGSIDRLTTYARGESLSDRQRQALLEETQLAEQQPPSLGEVVAAAQAAIDRALDQVKATPEASLLDARRVGRAGLPSTVIGLLVHVAEHTTRHVGQAMTTARILAGQ